MLGALPVHRDGQSLLELIGRMVVARSHMFPKSCDFIPYLVYPGLTQSTITQTDPTGQALHSPHVTTRCCRLNPITCCLLYINSPTTAPPSVAPFPVCPKKRPLFVATITVPPQKSCQRHCSNRLASSGAALMRQKMISAWHAAVTTEILKEFL